MTGMVHQLDPLRGTIYLAKETAPDFRCRLAIEVTSPGTQKNDIIDKRGIFADAGFEQYVMVNLPDSTKKTPGPLHLTDLRPCPGVYMDPLPSRKSGRVPLEALGVWLGVKDGELAVFESERGKRIADYTEAVRAMERSKRQAARAERRLAAAKQEAADLARRLKEVEEELRRLRGG